MDQQTEFRILVIDDNPAIHADFQKILKIREANASIDNLSKLVFGNAIPKTLENQAFNAIDLPVFQIDSASQGEEGVHCIENAIKTGRPYALAFVDVRMPPGMDGIETIKRIWALDNEIEIVICTAYSDYTWEQTIEILGVRDNLLIMKKPFDSISIRQLTCSLTKKWRLMQDSKNREKHLEEKVQQRTDSLQESLSALEYQSSHDILTSLPNRALLVEKIGKEIVRASKEDTMFAVIFIDLDRFKLINDSLSHESGDDLLKQIASRLEQITREEDTIARLSGDEFIFIHVPTGVHDIQALVSIANRILAAINENMKIAKRDIMISASLGITVFPKDGTTVEELLRNADLAMYRSKALGGNQFQLYTSELQEECETRLEQEYELRNAFINKEFYIEYQPQHDDKGGMLVGVEALLRWKHPKKGILLPLDFIPLAEDTGLIVPIGEWVINEACRQNKAWQDKGYGPFPVAVNVSTKQFMQPNFTQMIKKALDTSKLDPQYLEVEVTENTILSASNVVDSIGDLKKLGVNIVLDDFGSGNSGFNFLHKVPIDQLKIDKSFVQNIDSGGFDSAIVKAILDLAGSLKLDVVAEGIENTTQLKFLESHDCHKFQGFYFHKPMSVEQIEELITKKKE